ncbi:MAG TPA: type 4a pilus biogenesis protein PilO [Pirellulales bacterium]
MSVSPRKRRPSDKKKSGRRIQNANQLRVLLTGAVLAVAYMGIYGPLSAQIDKSRENLAVERKRLDVVRDIDKLREQYKSFKDRLPAKSDTNEWVQYVLGGVRKFPLKLLTLDPDKVRDVGPYKAVVLRIDLEGALRDINDFLKWLETNDRFIRIDSVSIQPVRNGKGMLMVSLTVVGIMG